MAIFGLTTHRIVEVGKLHGLLSGHMIAQAEYDTGSANGTLDNGFILTLDKATGKLVKAGAASKEIFLHYTEELMTGLVSGYEYFTVEADANGICYPRAIALYVGDEFVTDNVAGTIPANGSFAKAQIANGVITVNAAPTAGNPLFLVKKDTLPNGTAAAYVLYVGLAV